MTRRENIQRLLSPESIAFVGGRDMAGAIRNYLNGVALWPDLHGGRRVDRFGLALVIGSGGTLVELVGDSDTLLLPTGRRDVERALDSLLASRLIAGFHGGPEGDREAVVESVLSIAAFAGRHCDCIEELDVNPLLVLPRGRGAVAADALIRMQPE